MPDPRALDGPIGLVGAGYIGHLFAQQFALAGYEVRAWSPGDVVGAPCPTGCGKASPRWSMSAPSGPPAVDEVAEHESQAHDDLDTALDPCAAVMESIVEDAQAKAGLLLGIEAVIGADVPLWSSTSNFPMTRLAAGMAHPERAIVAPPRADPADHLRRGRSPGTH